MKGTNGPDTALPCVCTPTGVDGMSEHAFYVRTPANGSTLSWYLA